MEIVDLLEKHGSTSFSHAKRFKLIKKIDEMFPEEDADLFVKNFFAFLKYDEHKEFVMDFDDVWPFLGYSKKDKCKDVLMRHFKEGKDYVIKPLNGGVTGIHPDALNRGAGLDRTPVIIHSDPLNQGAISDSTPALTESQLRGHGLNKHKSECKPCFNAYERARIRRKKEREMEKITLIKINVILHHE